MISICAVWILAAQAFLTLAQQDAPPSVCRPVPEKLNLTPLPDPFTFLNGDPVLTKADWSCRRAEIATLIQRYGLGYLPTTKPTVTGALWVTEEAAVRLNVTVTEGEKTISFSAAIVPPRAPVEAEPNASDGPWPAIIAIGSSSITPIPGVGLITFPNDLIAQQQSAPGSRGVGLFYDLYGADHSAGAQIAWTWGVSRLIDALEQVHEEANVDVKHLGVTGCSRNGKGALVIGAFEERIALTIPQEGGAGGSSCWRIQDALSKRGVETQTAPQIIRENVWFGKAFNDFVQQVGVLPYDQHLLSALIAPRALYLPENGVIPWLGPESAWGCQRAARTVWKALGVEDNIGFGQTTGTSDDHGHCVFPVDAQLPGLTAFVDKFLKGKSDTETSFFNTSAEFPEYTDEFWIKWETPTLE